MIPLAGIATGALAIFLSHQRGLAKIKAQSQNNVSESVRAELDEMRRQMAELRDTTTKFDISFDAAISRLEDRVDRVEAGQAAAEPSRTYGTPTADTGTNTLTQGRG
ncbi:MAG TPA: hypothetical protein VM490_21710 [Armatimonadaceae bacterium]|nr:hypothetical protein [Armatimonadaceae bacterium]